ncbi:Nn.00g111140.m01.CDS01 [Neocucurbitaria sp. VM-36]
MPAVVSKPQTQASRKRRVHAKSRDGCGNCKLRRVKCDEQHPSCKKCKSYGVICNYSGSKASLDLSAQGSFQLELAPAAPMEQFVDFGLVHPLGNTSISPDQVPAVGEQVQHPNIKYVDPVPEFWPNVSWPALSPISMKSTIAVMIDDSLQSSLSSPGSQLSLGTASSWSPTPFLHFTESHLDIMARFHNRTAMTVGNKQVAPVYRDIVCKLASTHAFLMHMLLGLTLMHDAELSLSRSPSLAAKQKHSSLQHWNIATELFNQVLARPIPPSYRDARYDSRSSPPSCYTNLWATGVFLGAASFWYLESTSVEKVWPLKPDDPSDLTWMKLGEGKRHLWRVADPTRPESLFSDIIQVRPCADLPDWVETDNTSRICGRVRQILNITPGSTITNNVYHLPAIILSRIQDLQLTQENVLKFLYITAFITPEFLALLETKDPRTVFILGWWFKMMRDGELWWMARRAKVEGEAIRVWLLREDPGLAELLDSLGVR